MYLRLVVPHRDEDSHREAGVFRAAYGHFDGAQLAPAQRALLKEALDWFAHNLHVPAIAEPRAIFWFRGGRNPCVARVWDLVWLLRDLGEHPHLLKVRRPGYLVYEDSHQVAAIPFRGSRR
ncbi:MAG: hypothetical protein ACYTGZ_20970 [Planctomycetota bacterium]|jgi:hypothetical protein